MKRKLFTIFLAMFLGTGIVGMTHTHGGEFDQGKALYDAKCLICHGAHGNGEGRAAAALFTKPKDFTQPRFWQGNVDKKIADVIRKGVSPMPAFDLSDAEIKSIIDYMKQTFKK